MSDQEQYQIIGKVVADYAEVRKRLAALVHKADHLAETMETVGRSLKARPPHGEAHVISANFVAALQGFPTREEISELLSEIAGAKALKRDLVNQLREMGMEPKD